MASKQANELALALQLSSSETKRGYYRVAAMNIFCRKAHWMAAQIKGRQVESILLHCCFTVFNQVDFSCFHKRLLLWKNKRAITIYTLWPGGCFPPPFSSLLFFLILFILIVEASSILNELCEFATNKKSKKWWFEGHADNRETIWLAPHFRMIECTGTNHMEVSTSLRLSTSFAFEKSYFLCNSFSVPWAFCHSFLLHQLSFCFVRFFLPLFSSFGTLGAVRLSIHFFYLGSSYFFYAARFNCKWLVWVGDLLSFEPFLLFPLFG